MKKKKLTRATGDREYGNIFSVEQLHCSLKVVDSKLSCALCFIHGCTVFKGSGKPSESFGFRIELGACRLSARLMYAL